MTVLFLSVFISKFYITLIAVNNTSQLSELTHRERWTVRARTGTGTRWRGRYRWRYTPRSVWAGSDPLEPSCRHQTWRKQKQTMNIYNIQRNLPVDIKPKENKKEHLQHKEEVSHLKKKNQTMNFYNTERKN